MKFPMQLALVTLVFWEYSALACSHVDGYVPNLDIYKALKTSMADAMEWKEGAVVSIKPIPKKSKSRYSHTAIVFRKRDLSCYELQVDLYGGDGDCHGRVHFVNSKKIDGKKCKMKRK